MSDIKTVTAAAQPAVEPPTPLKNALPEVEVLTPAMLPNPIRDFVFDVAERTQCPPEYVAVAALVSVATAVGRKFAIHPKQHDNWLVIPNLWGAIIGPPSAMKSPALQEAVRPLFELEREFQDFRAAQSQEHEILADLSRANQQAVRRDAAQQLREGDQEAALAMMRENQIADELAPARRLIVNDSTIEKLGELLNENPNGLLLYRDELSGLFAKLSQEEGQSDRAFYLECFDGNGRFTYDRIGRGTIVIENCIINVVGGIQPSKIARLIRLALSGVADDGLVQRLQLAVWPDLKSDWQWNDRAPNKEAYQGYRQLIRDLDSLPIATAGPNNLRFSIEAQDQFAQWMIKLQTDLRNNDDHSVLQSHFAKSPKSVASLALLFELISGGRTEVSAKSLALALQWASFLRSHTIRLYHISVSASIDNAKLILKRRAKLKPTFTARDVRRKGWAGLSDQADVIEALECLMDHDYLLEGRVGGGASGGRPTTAYRWSPGVPADA